MFYSIFKKKSFLIILSILLLANFAITNMSLALDPNDPYGLKKTANKAFGEDSITKAPTIQEAVGQIIGVILSFLGIIFFVLVIYGGFLWMTAAGSEEQVGKAKKIIAYAAIGIIIILSAYIITNFITTEFTKIVAPAG